MASLDAFNILNRANHQNYLGAMRSPLFGEPAGALPPRRPQAGFRFQFRPDASSQLPHDTRISCSVPDRPETTFPEILLHRCGQSHPGLWIASGADVNSSDAGVEFITTESRVRQLRQRLSAGSGIVPHLEMLL